MADQTGRVTKAKKIHQEANQKRVDEINELRISYKKIKDEPAFLDILYKLQQFADLHLSLAKAGGGYEDAGADISGKPQQKYVRFTMEQRTAALDKADGLDQGIAYIKRQVADEALVPIKAKKVVV